MRQVLNLVSWLKPRNFQMMKAAAKQRLQLRFIASSAQTVARLPVRPLKQTLDRFLVTARPLLTADLYKHACQLVEKFESSGGGKLQLLLEDKARNSPNWLEEWWSNYAYLEYRDPAPIYVNPGILLPQFPFQGTDGQLRYAANFIVRALEYKKTIDAGAVPVERMGGAELCMHQYYRVLGGCRVPGASRDSVNFYPGGQPQSPKHIIVIHNGHMFSMNIYDGEGRPLSGNDLYQQLQHIIQQSPSDAAAPIGLLTSQHRDVWYQAYSQLKQDSVNSSNLSEIERGIFVLSLDKTPDWSTACRDTVQLNEVHHGSGSRSNSVNRWFDKILQVFVSPDGLIGFNYEHSTAEGPPVIHLIDYCCSNLDGNISDNKTSPYDGPLPRRLDFNITPTVKLAVDEAGKAFDALIADLDLVYFCFDKFGKKDIKQQRMSPDAFIQVALQLAYYRLYGQCAATYESGSLRKFHHGRTDTIRSCTEQSLEYCRAMSNNQMSVQQKALCLKAATEAHTNYTQLVVNANGIDRHLLGLKLIAKEHGLPVPELLNDRVYQDTCYWRLSTSQVASKTGGLLCFGPVVPDGYGMCYNPMDNRLLFAISSWKSCAETDSRKLRASLSESLIDGLNVARAADSTSKL